MYATDLADRLEYQVLPALKGGFIVLADRYIYTAIARGIARGAGKTGSAITSGFALTPDQVFFQPRWWTWSASGRQDELLGSGMDMNFGDDLFDSFVAYQGELIRQFDIMAEEYQFLTLDGRLEPQQIQKQLGAVCLSHQHRQAAAIMPSGK
jgi:dTMP kinase